MSTFNWILGFCCLVYPTRAQAQEPLTSDPAMEPQPAGAGHLPGESTGVLKLHIGDGVKA